MSIGTPRAHDTRNDALGASCSPAALRRSSLTPVWLNSTVKCQSGFGLGETEEGTARNPWDYRLFRER